MAFLRTPLATSFPRSEEHQNASHTSQKSLTFGNASSLRVDASVGAMTISPSGRDVALAGRTGLFIVDLDDPFSPPRWLHHYTSWEVADVQWSPHASKPSWVISTSNQKALVWNLALPSSSAIEHMLHGHTRAITDINFNAFQPEVIATCSVDSFVHVWDMRDSKKLVQSFADWKAGATQVKWSRMNPHIIASAHDRKVYIWDSRNGSVPLHTLEGHDGKVNGLDFCRITDGRIMTCSNDGTVKEWSYTESSHEPIHTMITRFPVWRARYTPFGNAAVVMPLRGGSNTVYLTGFSDQSATSPLMPLHQFRGHSEPVKEFVWRTRGGNEGIEDREFQLVTWSKDHDLRLWPVSQTVLEQANYKSGEPLKQRMTRLGSPYLTYRPEPSNSKKAINNPIPGQANMFGLSPETKRSKNHEVYMTGGYSIRRAPDNSHLNWISGVRIGRSAFDGPLDTSVATVAEESADGSSAPGNLGEELSILGHKFPKVRFEKISVSTGEVIISLNGPWAEEENELVFLRLEIKFPRSYPLQPPVFNFEKTGSLDDSILSKLHEDLNYIARNFSLKGKFALESCIRYLLGEKVGEQYFAFEDDGFDTNLNQSSNASDEDMLELDEEFDYGLSSDEELAETVPKFKLAFDSTPVPKGCGAVWTRNGELVCFFTQRSEKQKLQPITVKDGPNDIISFANGENFLSDSDDDILEARLGFGIHWPSEVSTQLATQQFRMNPFGARSVISNTENSGTGTLRGEPEKNIVRVYDLSKLIPSKRNLASEYKIVGESQVDLALHNADVATKFGCVDVADCWKLIAMLVDGDLGIDSSVPTWRSVFDKGSRPNSDWSGHPFGKEWIIQQIFDYFERQNNTQMLANLSCVLSGRLLRSSERLMQSDEVVGDLQQNMTQTGSFTLKPSLSQPQFSKASKDHNSFSSFFGNPRTAPWDIPSQVPSTFVEQLSSTSASSKDDGSIISLSPEKFMNARRTVAGIFSRGNNVSDSSKFRRSPLEARGDIGNSTADNEYPLSLAYGSTYSTKAVSRSSFVESESGDASISAVLPKVNVEYVNQYTIDPLEQLGRYTTEREDKHNLLSLSDEPKYQDHRWQYARILYSWGLEIESIEVLKFNFNSSVKPSTSLYRESYSVNVDFRFDDSMLYDEPGNAIESNNRNYAQLCHYCQLLIKTRYVLCTTCEHMIHFECAKDWWLDSGGTECVSGCGCRCTTTDQIF